MTLGAHAGPHWLITPGTESSLLVQASRHWQASSPSNDGLGFRLEGRHGAGRRTLLNFNGSWRERSWRDQPDWDGPVVNLGFGARYQFTPLVILNASVSGERDRSDQNTRRNKSFDLRLGVSRDLPRGFTVGLDGSVNWTRYDESG